MIMLFADTDEFLAEMDEETESLQSTVYILQEQLQQQTQRADELQNQLTLLQQGQPFPAAAVPDNPLDGDNVEMVAGDLTCIVARENAHQSEEVREAEQPMDTCEADGGPVLNGTEESQTPPPPPVTSTTSVAPRSTRKTRAAAAAAVAALEADHQHHEQQLTRTDSS